MQRGFTPYGLDVDVASGAAVAAVCGAGGDIFFAEEGDAAVATGAGVEGYGGAVGEGGEGVVGRWRVQAGDVVRLSFRRSGIGLSALQSCAETSDGYSS